MPKKSKYTPEKSREVADLVLEGKNQTKALLQVFPEVNPVSARAMGSQIMNREDVKQYIQNQAGEAASRIVEIAKTSENDMVKLNANKDILDRAGFKPIDESISLVMPLYLPPEIMDKYDLEGVKKYAETPPPPEGEKSGSYFRTKEEEYKWKKENGNTTTNNPEPHTGPKTNN